MISCVFSGTPTATQILHDQTIEENETTACDPNSPKNEENTTETPETILNAPDFNLKENSMAIYYGWQLVCLIIFIFTTYETLQSM